MLLSDVSEWFSDAVISEGSWRVSEGSLEKPVSSAVYFYDAGGSVVWELIATMHKAACEDFTQRVRSSSAQNAKIKYPGETGSKNHLNLDRQLKTFCFWKLLWKMEKNVQKALT